MSERFEFIVAGVDDPEADKFFDLSSHSTDENRHMINYSPDVKKNEIVSQSGVSKKEMISRDLNIENEDPCITKKTVKSPEKIKNSPQILRKVLNEIENHRIQQTTGKLDQVESTSSDKELSQHLEKLHISDSVKSRKSRAPFRATQMFEGLVIEKPEPKPHRMTTRLDSILKTPVLKLRSRSVTKQLKTEDADSDHSVSSSTHAVSSSTASAPAQPINAAKRLGSPLNSVKKYISLAEQVQHFHKDTPDRFRSKPKNPHRQQQSLIRTTCVPKTPNLATKHRHRPSNFPNEKEREEMELEEIRRNQVKAHPLNEKILRGPSLNLKTVIEKKPNTIPEPFALTEVKKKNETSHEEVFQFKAQPVPVTILQRPVGIPPKKVAKPTTPQTPHIKVPMRFRKEVRSPDSCSSASAELSSPPKNTKVQPFSFDERMKNLLRRKEETVKKIIEEEKKTFNSFKAHPMPSFQNSERKAKHERTPHRIEVKPFNLTRPKEHKSVVLAEEIQSRVTPFKAKPATVIHQKPFVPVKPKHDVFLPGEFHLNTEKRAIERQKFDESIKQKEEESSALLRQRKEEEERMEKLLKMEERKKAEFRATPVPRYRPFEIRAADPSKLTLPQSPMFTSGKAKETKRH